MEEISMSMVTLEAGICGFASRISAKRDGDEMALACKAKGRRKVNGQAQHDYGPRPNLLA